MKSGGQCRFPPAFFSQKGHSRLVIDGDYTGMNGQYSTLVEHHCQTSSQQQPNRGLVCIGQGIHDDLLTISKQKHSSILPEKVQVFTGQAKFISLVAPTQRNGPFGFPEMDPDIGVSLVRLQLQQSQL